VQEIGRFLIVLGVVSVFVGAVLLLAGRLPWLGRLPGDIVIRRDHVTFYFPIVTSIVLSLLLTLLLNLFRRR
jgi:hypothetical protein